MIKSFGSKETEQIWKGRRSKKLPFEIQQIGRRKFRMINNAQIINDLRIPPANRLKRLKGELKGIYSIRINAHWRITFSWTNNNAKQVKIEDFHG